jgi:hypothetical protein
MYAAGRGLVRRGLVWPGQAWLGEGWQGKAGILAYPHVRGMARLGMAWQGGAGQGKARKNILKTQFLSRPTPSISPNRQSATD